MTTKKDDGEKDGEGGEGEGPGIDIQRICQIHVRSLSVFSHQMHDVVAGIRGTETVKAEHMSGLAAADPLGSDWERVP